MTYTTDQEKFWASQFGNDYISRNIGEEKISSNISLFSKILSSTHSVDSIIEFGSNIGLNLIALRALLPNSNLSAIEINKKAVDHLNNIEDLNVYHSSILDYVPDVARDLALIKCVLIHINPDMLHKVYELLYKASRRYICIAEYYNPSPVQVKYRGYEGKLFKRDFAGEMMDIYKDLELIDYGFVYHRDCNFPQDDMTWFLLEKNSN
jgi:spore coat polysaccharide biosynthesis protein SpsF